MKKIILLAISALIMQSSLAGEVTGAGLKRILQRNNIDVASFGNQGLGIMVKGNRANPSLDRIRYYIGESSVYPSQNVNRIEFTSPQTGFNWQSVESLEVKRRMLFPEEVKGFVIQK